MSKTNSNSKDQELLFNDMLKDIDKELDNNHTGMGIISKPLAVCICVVVVAVLLIMCGCVLQLQLVTQENNPIVYPVIYFCREGGDPEIPTTTDDDIIKTTTATFNSITCNKITLTAPIDDSPRPVDLSWNCSDRENLFIAAHPSDVDVLELDFHKFNNTLISVFSNGVIQEEGSVSLDIPITITVQATTPWGQLLAQLPILSAATLGAAVFSAATDEKMKRKSGLRMPQASA